MQADQRQDLGGGGRDVGARAEDRADPGLLQEIVIPSRDHAATELGFNPDQGEPSSCQKIETGKCV